MPFFDPIRIGASGAADFEIERSLRFNRPDSTYLTKSLGSTSNRRTFTYSFWVKRTVQNSEQCLIYNGHPSSTPYGEIRFEYQGSNIHELNWYSYDGSHQFQLRTNRVFRDPSAWYHIVLALDTTQATQSNRAKIYVNGIQETSFKTETYPSQNTDTGYNVSGNTHSIGGFRNTSNSFDGYVAEFNFIDGQPLTPSSFAKTNSDTGQWVPIDTSGLTFGTNGFRLKFADNSGTTATTLGKDSSGNGNNFTPTNFATNDAVKDSPTNNFCTLNPLQKNPNGVYSEGNLRLEPSSSYNTTIGSMGVSSGKYYFEARCNGISGGVGQERWIFGIHETTGHDFSNATYWYSSSYTIANYGYVYGVQDGNKKITNETQSDFTSNFAVGDVIGFKLNLDDNELSISVNGTDKGKIFDIQGGKTYAPAGNFNHNGTSVTLNCGQDSTFHGQESSGGNTDSGGIGDFAYSVPSGYKALCSANLPDPTILLPNEHFDILLWSGNSSTQAITGLNFSPDLVWSKRRSASSSNYLSDTIRGVHKILFSELTNAEYDGTSNNDGVDSFDSNGFTFQNGTYVADYNASGSTYVGWNWKAGGSASSNSNGTITSSVSVNASAGFSIVAYTGTGSAGATVGHGLGVTPNVIIIKNRTDTSGAYWSVYHSAAFNNASDSNILYWNTNNAEADDTNVLGTSVTINSTVFSLGDYAGTNASGGNMISYCFSEVAGYSKFGSYTGNGSSDGTFVYTSFRPAYVIIKGTVAMDWVIDDTTRSPFNESNATVFTNLSDAEYTGGAYGIDFYSNGFKPYNTYTQYNQSGTKYIYLAFAESPFKYARAR